MSARRHDGRRTASQQAVATAAAAKPRRKTPAPWRPIPLCINGLKAAQETGYTPVHVSRILRQHARAHHQDVDRPSSRRARRDEGGLEPGNARHAVRTGAVHHQRQYRSGPRGRRGDLPGHGDADLRNPRAARRRPDLDDRSDPPRRGRSDQARQVAPELRRFHHREELRRQSRPGDARHPFSPVGAGRHRGEAAAQGRRVRELQRAVRGTGGARSPGPGRPQPRRRAQVHPARHLAGAGQGLQPRSRRRLHWRRPRVGLRARQGAAVPDAGRCEPRAGAGGPRSEHHGYGEHAGHRHDGLRGTDDAHRVQDRRDQPAAGQLLRVGGLRLLGVPPPRRRARRHDRRDHAVAVPRPVEPGRADGGPGRLQAQRQGSRPHGAVQRGRHPRVEGGRCRAPQRPRCSPAATRCMPTS